MNIIELEKEGLRNGDFLITRSQKQLYKHHLTGHPVHKSWLKIIERCYDEKCKQYARYGGRGILTEPSWRYNFKEFYDYVVSLPNYDESNIGKYKKYTLDRIDNNIGYFKGNLRWATTTEQVINRRINSNNKSGYVGVYFEKNGGYPRWRSTVGVNYKKLTLGSFKTCEEALKVRNNYIITHNLPLKIQ
jgi:hypothetical protein